MIHVFHGFLGSPSDFSFLPKKKDILLHDLYHFDLDTLEISPEDTLIGYSMGGRFALELASKFQFKIKKLVIINSHPGLADEDKKERNLWEESVLQRLRTDTPGEFLTYWNSLPLFKNDAPLTELSTEKLRASAPLFDKMRLSNQKNFLDELKIHRSKILWISSPQDEKYYQITKKMIVPLGIHCCFIPGGHRLFQRHIELLAVFKEEGIL